MRGEKNICLNDPKTEEEEVGKRKGERKRKESQGRRKNRRKRRRETAVITR
jgi:hypothetical protein